MAWVGLFFYHNILTTLSDGVKRERWIMSLLIWTHVSKVAPDFEGRSIDWATTPRLCLINQLQLLLVPLHAQHSPGSPSDLRFGSPRTRLCRRVPGWSSGWAPRPGKWAPVPGLPRVPGCTRRIPGTGWSAASSTPARSSGSGSWSRRRSLPDLLEWFMIDVQDLSREETKRLGSNPGPIDSVTADGWQSKNADMDSWSSSVPPGGIKPQLS